MSEAEYCLLRCVLTTVSGGSEREQVECVAVESLRVGCLAYFSLWAIELPRKRRLFPRDLNSVFQNTVMSVYTQPRVLTADCIKSVQARCMTKFGPGSSLLDSLDEWERGGTNVYYKVGFLCGCLSLGRS